MYILNNIWRAGLLPALSAERYAFISSLGNAPFGGWLGVSHHTQALGDSCEHYSHLCFMYTNNTYSHYMMIDHSPRLRCLSATYIDLSRSAPHFQDWPSLLPRCQSYNKVGIYLLHSCNPVDLGKSLWLVLMQPWIEFILHILAHNF